MKSNQLTNDCLELCQLASNSVKKYFRNDLNVERKSDLSPVTVADQATEHLIRSCIASKYPDHGFYGEEGGQFGTDREFVWVVDPIDGTRSFISGHPLFGFLIAVLQNGKPVASAISMPMLDEIFCSRPDSSVELNGKTIKTSETQVLEEAILFINEGDKLYNAEPDLMKRLMKSGQTRRFSYDCYSHALVAGGFVDAVVDYDLKPYDFMPLIPIIEGAGGVISGWKGEHLDLAYEGPIISTANSSLHARLLAVLNQ